MQQDKTNQKVIPGTTRDEQSTIEELESKLKESEAALRKAELRADAYDELINVAETKFNISIRKKAGAKQ